MTLDTFSSPLFSFNAQTEARAALAALQADADALRAQLSAQAAEHDAALKKAAANAAAAKHAWDEERQALYDEMDNRAAAHKSVVEEKAKQNAFFDEAVAAEKAEKARVAAEKERALQDAQTSLAAANATITQHTTTITQHMTTITQLQQTLVTHTTHITSCSSICVASSRKMQLKLKDESSALFTSPMASDALP